MSDNDNKLHHPYGPSRWPGLCECPGYKPSPFGGEFAERGTAIHEAMETGDYSKLREDDRETAVWMTNELARMTQGLDTEAEIETEILADDADGIGPVAGVTGTCDRRWKTEDGTLHVADFKGFSKIGVGNYEAQLAGYILGGDCPKKEPIVCHVFHGGSRQVETFEMTWDECLHHARAVCFAIRNPDAPRKRSRHCDHCAHASDCPESAKAIAFGSLVAGRLTRENVAANPAEAARLCDWIDAALNRLEEARDIISETAKAGVPIEDPATGIRYEVQRCVGRAAVPPLSEIFDRLMSEDGIDEKDIVKRSTITLTNLRDLVGTARAEEYAVRGEDTLKFIRARPSKKSLKA